MHRTEKMRTGAELEVEPPLRLIRLLPLLLLPPRFRCRVLGGLRLEHLLRLLRGQRVQRPLVELRYLHKMYMFEVLMMESDEAGAGCGLCLEQYATPRRRALLPAHTFQAIAW